MTEHRATCHGVRGLVLDEVLEDLQMPLGAQKLSGFLADLGISGPAA